MPSYSKLPDVVVVLVALLNRTRFAAPTTFVERVAVSAVPVNEPFKFGQFNVFVEASNVKSPSVAVVAVSYTHLTLPTILLV